MSLKMSSFLSSASSSSSSLSAAPAPSEAERLLVSTENENFKRIRLDACGWRRFLNGISNRYDDSYPAGLHNIISVDDFTRVMKSLHNKIISHWPCDTCYLFGIGCAPCTLGASLLCPRKCATLAEKEAVIFLNDVSLNKKYYDRNISFSLKKTFWSSYIEIAVPLELFKGISDVEKDSQFHSKGKRS